MTPVNRLAQVSWLILTALVRLPLLCYAQTTATCVCPGQSGDGNVLNSPADESVAIRFFLQPPGDYFHAPLVFRVVDQKDPCLNTAPMLESGRTAYITLSEMQRLLPAVSHTRYWQEGEVVEVLGSPSVLSIARMMDITIVSSHGTARGTLDPKEICHTLGPWDSLLRTPRALWEFQLFRQGYDCKVPGFNYDAYPEHNRR